MLEQIGISFVNDCVIRKTYFKYLHPKEAYIANGILNPDLVRVATGKAKEVEQKQGKYAKRYRDTKDELQNKDENGGLAFVYPYGSTLNVRKPSFPILSSGPISFPAHRPVGAFYMSPKRGKLFVLGSMRFLEDEFFEKEDN
jgi:intraflagellar transport protein 52